MRGLLYIVLLIVITGCGYSGSNYKSGLDEAENMLGENPEKAFNMLNGYDVAEFKDSATMARWALLYGEALVANKLAAPTDTIINIAVDYYSSHISAEDYLSRAQKAKALLSKSTGHSALASALYIQKEKEFMLYKERARRNQLLLIGMIVLLAAIGIIIWQRQHIKLKNAKADALIAEASFLKKSLENRKNECSVLANKLSASLANRFNMIDELCETFYESQGSKNEKKAIVDKVKYHIDAIKNDNGIFNEMEQCHEEILTRLRNDFTTLKPEEYRLMVYIVSGLSNRTIALLIGESIDTTYKRKSRLKAKIASSSSPNKDILLSVF